MEKFHYNFVDTGYKIHLPVVPNSNDPLTREIVDFLDEKFGLQTNYKDMYKTPFYKVGSGGELIDGKGITLYGRTSSMNEMQELAKEIEQKFGQELTENIQKYNIKFADPIKLSNSVQARFAQYNYSKIDPINGKYLTLTADYQIGQNPSGAVGCRYFKTKSGSIKAVMGGENWFNALSDIDKKFLYGDSTLQAIDSCGEFFTGKLENGKIPKFIMDGLPKEYLEHYNINEKDIIARINKGTKQLVAHMLEDVANNPTSKILQGKPPWLTTLDKKVIEEAKTLLHDINPEALQKLEKMLPQLEKICPTFSILRKTKTLAGISKVTTPVHSSNNWSWLDDAVAKYKANVVKPNVSTPVNKYDTIAKRVIDSFKNKGGKAGLCIVGATILTGTAVSIFNKDRCNNIAINNKIIKGDYNTYLTNSKGNMTV